MKENGKMKNNKKSSGIKRQNNNVKSNKLIAEFLGWHSNDEKTLYEVPPKYYSEYFGPFPCWVTGLDFDTSWDWLMPVVQKIEKQCYASVSITFEECYICSLSAKYEKGFADKDKLKATYKGVVSFIKWWNKGNGR